MLPIKVITGSQNDIFQNRADSDSGSNNSNISEFLSKKRIA
jgi:hypothetical protein